MPDGPSRIEANPLELPSSPIPLREAAVLSRVIFRTWSDSEAELIRGILECNGIPCAVISDITHAVYPLTVNGLGEIRLSVPEEAAEEAEGILRAHRVAGTEEAVPPEGAAPGTGRDD